VDNKQFLSLYEEYINRSDSFNIDATYMCPLQCPFCVRNRRTPHRDEVIHNSRTITFEDFMKIVEFSKHISFCGQMSDPIYAPNFLELLNILHRKKNITVSIHTTGTRKKLDWWERAFRLSHFNVRWVFGLDGISQESAEKHRVNTRFDDVMQVMKLGASMGVNVNWQFIVFQHNKSEVEKAIEISKQHGIKLIVLKSNRWRMEHDVLKPPSDEWISPTVREERIVFV
jgi:MoaA/NifB/PqqE/SkfB family radical SAM enzyme